MFDQTPPHTHDKIVAKPIKKQSQSLELKPKIQSHSKMQKIIT